MIVIFSASPMQSSIHAIIGWCCCTSAEFYVHDCPFHLIACVKFYIRVCKGSSRWVGTSRAQMEVCWIGRRLQKLSPKGSASSPMLLDGHTWHTIASGECVSVCFSVCGSFRCWCVRTCVPEYVRLSVVLKRLCRCGNFETKTLLCDLFYIHPASPQAMVFTKRGQYVLKINCQMSLLYGRSPQ